MRYRRANSAGRAVFLNMGLALALCLFTAQNVFAMDTQQAVINIQYIELARLDGQACERLNPGATKKFEAWLTTVQYIQKKSVKAIDEYALKKGLGEEDFRSVTSQSIDVINRSVVDMYRISTRRCAAIEKTLDFYKSQLKE